MILNDLRIDDVLSLHYIPIYKGEKRRITNRISSALVFSPVGRSLYQSKGILCLNDNSNVVLMPKGATYEITCVNSDICPLINFKSNNICSDIMQFSFDDTNKLLEDFDETKKALENLSPGCQFKALSYVYKILNSLSCEAQIKEKKLPEIVSRAVSFIKENYTNPSVTNSTIAENLNISTIYLRKLFTKHMGISPIKYVNNLRTSNAKALLTQTNLSVISIAQKTGYNCPYTFSRAFKSATGYCPTDYRERN